MSNKPLKRILRTARVRMRLERKSAEGKFNVAPRATSGKPEDGRGAVKIPPTPQSLAVTIPVSRAPFSVSSIEKRHLPPFCAQALLAIPRIRCASSGLMFRISSSEARRADNARDLYDAMISRYPDRVNRAMLWHSAQAMKG